MKTEIEFLGMVKAECDIAGKIYSEDMRSEAICWYESFDNISDNEMKAAARDLAEDWGEENN